MKITAKNIIDQWVDIKPLLPAELAKIGEESFLPNADLYDDFDEEMIKDFDLFLEKVNKYTDKPATDKPKTKRKYARGNGKKYRKKKPTPKKDKDTPKPKKDKKPAKPQVGESPAWLTTLKSFVKSFAGQTKDTWRVRKYVKEIQANFDAKRGGKTPHIDIIREIQDKLLPFANKDAKKVDIPKYDDLVSKCKSAINGKDFTVSKKAKKPELKKESLSGFRIGFSK